MRPDGWRVDARLGGPASTEDGTTPTRAQRTDSVYAREVRKHQPRDLKCISSVTNLSTPRTRKQWTSSSIVIFLTVTPIFMKN